MRSSSHSRATRLPTSTGRVAIPRTAAWRFGSFPSDFDDDGRVASEGVPVAGLQGHARRPRGSGRGWSGEVPGRPVARSRAALAVMPEVPRSSAGSTPGVSRIGDQGRLAWSDEAVAGEQRDVDGVADGAE